MCNLCGCNTPSEPHPHDHMHDDHAHPHDHAYPHDAHTHAERSRVRIEQAIIAAGDEQAAKNRALFDAARVLVVNLMSSPGSGKTTLLEETVTHCGLKIGVIEGDLATENDANRLRACGVQAEQITTGIACHLDAHMIADVLPRFDLSALDVLFIENVGNLICPACFDLGQHQNVTLLSVPEGDDKPEKYPIMFRDTDLTLVTKTDYLPVAPTFAVSRAVDSLRKVGSDASVIALCATLGDGLEDWLGWLARRRDRVRNGSSTSDAA